MGAEWTMPAAASRRRVGGEDGGGERGCLRRVKGREREEACGGWREEGEDASGGQEGVTPSWTSSMGGVAVEGCTAFVRMPAAVASRPAQPRIVIYATCR